MLKFSNDCGNAIHSGSDIRANIIPRPTETMIKSISQAMNLSIQLASIISLGCSVSDDGEGDEDDDIS